MINLQLEERESMLLYLSLIETEEDKIKFEDIFNSYKKTMYYVANSILKDEHYSHDAVQNSFLKIIKNIDKIEDVKSNKTKGFIVTYYSKELFNRHI